MNISIPLDSMPLLFSALLVVLGLAATPLSARLGVIGIGAGSIIAGAVAVTSVPNGMGPQGMILFGATAVVGALDGVSGFKEAAPEKKLRLPICGRFIWVMCIVECAAGP